MVRSVMPVYVFVVYYALPWCLVSIAAVAIVRLVRARRRGGETWRELVVIGASVASFALWYAAAGSELAAEWDRENTGTAVTLRGPAAAGERGFLRVWVAPPLGTTPAAHGDYPATFELTAEGDVRVVHPGGDASFHVVGAVIGGRAVRVDECGGAEGPEGWKTVYGIDGCSRIPFDWADRWIVESP